MASGELKAGYHRQASPHVIHTGEITSMGRNTALLPAAKD